MIHGSCMCGGVKYEISGMLTDVRNCHCSMCRKLQGSAFRSRATVQAAEFKFIRGEDLITYYESSKGTYRGFCSVCGSPIHSKFDEKPSVYGLPLGPLDDDPNARPGMHIHVASKAPWFEITDSLPQFAEGPNSSP